jgi:glycerophosphoryl diester phosphodiesterase
MIRAVRRHGMEDQVLLKTPAKMEYFKAIEELAPDMMFMPIYKEEDRFTEVLEQMKIHFVAAELVFAKDDSPLASADYIESHHKKGRLLWCNAILFNYLKPLSGGHTDDISVIGDPDAGWGWLIDRGFDIIQTDWSMPLRAYLDKR